MTDVLYAKGPAPAGAAFADDGPAGIRADASERRRLWISVLLVAIGWITVSLQGASPAVFALLAVASVFELGRHVAPATMPHWSVTALFCCWMLVTVALLVLGSQTVVPMYAYAMVGYAGYRLPLRSALSVALCAGVLCALGLHLAAVHHLDSWPWLLGFTITLPVFLGMANRSRDQAVISTVNAARSAQRAAEAEAREQALTERARISRDIHDVLAHSLTGVSMQLELSEMLLEDGDVDRARAAIDKAHSMVREGMAEARRAVTALRSETLPLRQTLEAQFAGAGQVRVEGSPVELSTEATQAVVRAAQEALTNARRHAAGAPVEVVLRYSPSEVALQVDTGAAVGASVPGAGSGMGLVGMRERAALLGGDVAAGPLTDGPLAGGWRVLLRLPVHGPSPAARSGSDRLPTAPERR